MMRNAQKTTQFTKQPDIQEVVPHVIESIQFSTFSGTDVLRAAEVQVSYGLLYDQSNEPIDNGLLDPHMGPPNKKGTCKTCAGKFSECPGHCGYFVLTLPVYNVGYLDTIVDIMKCICKVCSSVLLGETNRRDFLQEMRNPENGPLEKNVIMKEVVKKCNSNVPVKCFSCGYKNGMVKRENLGIQHDGARSRKIINPLKADQLLRKMRDEDCELLCVNVRPENLLVTNILVPPTAIRPSVFVDGWSNDITERLKRIIEANDKLVQTKSWVDWDCLQYEVAQYIDSAAHGVPSSFCPPKPMSGFVQRLKGKRGRFSRSLSRKRVEHTGRTVISPDPNLRVTEVAIPIPMARILSYPERVSLHNIEKLRQRVRNGPNKYPGAKFLRHPDGTQIFLGVSARNCHADELKYGCIVDRHLEDGDIVLIHRQPSLHRMSSMSHRARIMPWRTLRLNESVCNPYHADFDGDEMNIHVPQTEEARAEALMLMGVQNNLRTPKNGEIVVASTQDVLTSSFLITRKDTFYDRSSFSLMCSYMGDAMDPVDLPTPALVKPVELWTGKQLFNVLLRSQAKMRMFVNLTVAEKNYEKSRETMCPKDGFVYIRNSELISGQLGKATLGNGNKDGLYFVLLRDFGAHAAATCMSHLAKLSARWIGNNGFSIGIMDVQPGNAFKREKTQIIDKEYQYCTDYIESYSSGTLELLPGCNIAESLEAKMSETLNNIREITANVCMKNLNWRNSPLIMSQCGSKGSPINICQMIACVGQQIVGGRRAPNGFFGRTLPHFEKEAKDLEAKGFVQNSFYTGLSATEFFFHAMEGRKDLVDTAVKAAEKGSMSHGLMKLLEDLAVYYDNTVRNASACIVQFMYGDDGMDPGQVKEKSGLSLNFERLFMKSKATCPVMEDKSLTVEEIKGIVDKIIGDALSKEGCLGSFTNTSINIGDALLNKGCLESFTNSLRNFIEKKYPSSVLMLNEEQRSAEDRGYLVPSNVSGITREQLVVFLETCISHYHSKKIEPGTAIGAIGAQSIGEPGTQMMSKTFHFAGVASMNVTLGVPRIIEIIEAAKKIRTPIITVELMPDGADGIVANTVKGHIEGMLLEQVAEITTSQASAKPSIVIMLDMKRIQEAKLSIEASTVKELILQTENMEPKEPQVKLLHSGKLEVVPQFELEFELIELKHKLSKVVLVKFSHDLISVFHFPYGRRGISSVKRAIIINGENPGTNKLLVEGTGLFSIMRINGVDVNRTMSNHIMEVEQTLGIEAARKKIIDEMQYTMSSHGMTTDIRHMMLLADIMTFKGEVLGTARHGVQKMRDSVFLRAFEKTSDYLFDASVRGMLDSIESARECITMGIPMKLGTGMFKVVQREQPVELVYGSEPIL